MVTWLLSQTIDLQHPARAEESLVPLRTGDARGHTWRATVLRDKQPADLSGLTAHATFLRADGTAVAVEGSVRGNVAEVIFSGECCAVEGLLRGLLRLTDGDGTITLSELLLRVENGGISAPSPSGGALPSVMQLGQSVATLQNAMTSAQGRLDALDAAATRYALASADALNEDVLWQGSVNGSGATLTLSAPATNYDALRITYTLGTAQEAFVVAQPGDTFAIRGVDLSDAPADNAIGLRIIEMRLRLASNGASLSVLSAGYATWTGSASARAYGGSVQNGASVSDAGVLKRVTGVRFARSEEVTDLRTAWNGATHATAGEAVRAQIAALHERMDAADAARTAAGVCWDLTALLDALLISRTATGDFLTANAVPQTPIRCTTAPNATVWRTGRNLFGGATAAQLTEALNRLPDGDYALSLKLTLTQKGAAFTPSAVGGISVHYASGQVECIEPWGNAAVGETRTLALHIPMNRASRGAVQGVTLFGAEMGGTSVGQASASEWMLVRGAASAAYIAPSIAAATADAQGKIAFPASADGVTHLYGTAAQLTAQYYAKE